MRGSTSAQTERQSARDRQRSPRRNELHRVDANALGAAEGGRHRSAVEAGGVRPVLEGRPLARADHDAVLFARPRPCAHRHGSDLWVGRGRTRTRADLPPAAAGSKASALSAPGFGSASPSSSGAGGSASRLPCRLANAFISSAAGFPCGVKVRSFDPPEVGSARHSHPVVRSHVSNSNTPKAQNRDSEAS